jgi:hypothetical protein
MEMDGHFFCSRYIQDFSFIFLGRIFWSNFFEGKILEQSFASLFKKHLFIFICFQKSNEKTDIKMDFEVFFLMEDIFSDVIESHD